MQLHFDPLGGVAGDMMVAALLDLKPELAEGLFAALSRCPLLEGVSAELRPHNDGILSGRRFVVSRRGEGDHDHHHHDHARLQLQDLNPVDAGHRGGRRGRHREQVGHAGQRGGRLAHHLGDLVTLPDNPDAFTAGHGGRVGEQLVGVEAVAGIGRYPAGRGVRMGQETGSFKRRQFRTHGRRAPVETGQAADRLRSDGPAVLEVRLDHNPEDFLLSGRQLHQINNSVVENRSGQGLRTFKVAVALRVGASWDVIVNRIFDFLPR